MLRIHSIETFGTHEGPGIRLVFFLQGCHFRCLYCHNPDTWRIDGGQTMSTAQLVKKALQEKPYFGDLGGVTVSGGEPLVQRIELIKLFTALREERIHIAIDTNGFFLDEYAKKVFQLVDLVLLDVKHIDDTKHKPLTGQSNKPVLACAAYLEAIGKPVWLRYVLVPGYTDYEKDLHSWGNYFRSYKCIERVEILPFHTFGAYKYAALGIRNPLEVVHPPTPVEVQKAKEIFTQYFSHVYIR